jgi:DNA primase
MPISPEQIREILERTDLVALVSRHVELKRSGRSFKGLCPFHGEKTPSFHVNPERRSFKCFGCDAGGDAIAFEQRLSGRSFVEVVRSLAHEAGVTLEEREDPAARERAQLSEVSELARRHFEERLWSEAGRVGRDHLRERGVSEELAREFSLGYATLSWNDLASRLVREGILEWGARAGLCAPRRQADGYFDVFRGRLMIPIRSAEGRTLGFGGRILEEQVRPGGEPAPKYLNSRESPLYRKSEVLYGLDVAKDEIRRRRSAVLVEGYFDVIGLYSAGIKNAVALCSTALTAGHLSALSRADARELVLLLDGDAAGTRAVERLAGPILSAGASAKVASLPQGDDPDTFALREGAGAVERLIEGAPPLSRYLLDAALPRGHASSLEEKMAALARFKSVLGSMSPGVPKSLLIAELGSHLGLAESEVRSHLAQELRAPVRPKPAAPPTSLPAESLPDAHEEMFVALLIADPALRSDPELRFRDEMRSLELRLALESERPGESLAELPAELRAPIERRLKEIERTLVEPEARRRALKDTCRNMRLSRVEERIREKKAELAAAGDEEEVARLQVEHSQLSELRQRLKGRVAAGREVASGAALSQVRQEGAAEAIVRS